MNKLLIITGPTATGKTALGIELAKKFDGEIISADSRQVYRGDDIVTGKDKDLYQKAGIPVWGLDIVEPGHNFNVSDFVQFAKSSITDMARRGKLPVVVGGTGHYLRALLDPFATLNIPPDQKLRNQKWQLKELQDKLQEVDPKKWELMNLSDRNNSRRLIRAIEVAQQDAEHEILDTNNYNALIIGLTAPRDFLRQKIVTRRKDRPDLVDKEFSLAKKQLLYQKKFLHANWFDVTKSDYRDEIFAAVKKWYTSGNGGQKA